VRALRQIWLQQYYIQDDWAYWRTGNRGLPPAAKMISSPYDLEARFSTKRNNLEWVGYKTHLTESCDATQPHLITHVETTPATVQDVEVIDKIHTDLAEDGLLPREHLVDSGYVSIDVLVRSRDTHQVEVVGEVRPDNSWQAQANEGFDLSHFVVDWKQHLATCPAGQHSSHWKAYHLPTGKKTVQVAFAKKTCKDCPLRAQCTTNKAMGRQITLPDTQDKHEALLQARAYQRTEAFKARYRTRAGIEGTISQAVNPLDMRRSRYIGLQKTHLQDVLTATALNILRAVNWLLDKPLAKTRIPSFRALDPVT
jgi:transposase